MLGSAVRRAAGVSTGEPLDVRRRKLRARVATSGARRRREPRVAAFLGELAGVAVRRSRRRVAPAPRAADPMLMNDSMRERFDDWLAAECAGTPGGSRARGSALGRSADACSSPTQRCACSRDAPFFVVALARPEVHGRFRVCGPSASRRRSVSPALTRKACEKLVREVLGDAPTRRPWRAWSSAAKATRSSSRRCARGRRAARDSMCCPSPCSASCRARIDALRRMRGACCARRVSSVRRSGAAACSRCSATIDGPPGVHRTTRRSRVARSGRPGRTLRLVSARPSTCSDTRWCATRPTRC